MKMFIEFFKDTGTLSMTRLLCFICVISAVVIALHAISNGSDLSATAVLCGTFLGAGFGAKVWQAGIESKSEPTIEREIDNEKR